MSASPGHTLGYIQYEGRVAEGGRWCGGQASKASEYQHSGLTPGIPGSHEGVRILYVLSAPTPQKKSMPSKCGQLFLLSF